MSSPQDTEYLYRLLENTYNPDNESRKAAEVKIDQISQGEWYVKALFEVAAATQAQLEIRQSAAILLKNKLGNESDWNREDCKINQTERDCIKQHIIQTVTHAPPKVRAQLLMVVRRIVYFDFPERWSNLVEILAEQLRQSDTTQVVGAIFCLRQLAKRYEFTARDDDRSPLQSMMEKTFPQLTNILLKLREMMEQAVQQLQQGADFNSTISQMQEVAMLQKTLLKIFYSATQIEIHESVLTGPGAVMLNTWLEQMPGLLRTPAPTADYNSALWKTKKWVGHITQGLLQKYGGKYVSGAHKTFSVHYMSTYLVPYTQAFLAVLELFGHHKPVSPQVLSMATMFLGLVLNTKQYANIVLQEGVSKPLCESVLLPAVNFNEEDKELWDDNPEEYIRKLYDPISDFYSVRISIRSLLVKMAAAKDVPVFDNLMAHLRNRLAAYASAPPAQRNYAEKDGLLYVIGSLSYNLMKRDNYKAHLEGMLVEHVFPEFKSHEAYLRAKAIWCATQFSRIEWQVTATQNNFAVLFNGIMEALLDKEFPVRIQAGIALIKPLKNKTEEARKVILPRVVSLVDALFKLMAEVPTGHELVETLEIVIERYGESVESQAVEIMHRLLVNFVQTAPTSSIDSEQVLTDEFLTQEDHQALAAGSILKSAKTLLTAVGSGNANAKMFDRLEEPLMQVLPSLIKDDYVEYFDEILQILSYFVFWSKRATPNLWRVWVMTMKAFMDGWAVDFVPYMMDVLDNYISVDPQTFCKAAVHGFDPALEGKRYIQLFYEFCKMVLEGEDVDNYHTVPKLFCTMMEHCKDYHQEVIPYLPLCLDLLMATQHKYGKDLKPGFRILCFDVIADCFYFDAKVTMEYLCTKSIVQPVFEEWMNTVPKFTRWYDRKVSALGLITIVQTIIRDGTGWLPQPYFNPDRVKCLVQKLIELVISSYEIAVEYDETKDEDDEEYEESDADDFEFDDDEDSDEEADDDADDDGKEGNLMSGLGGLRSHDKQKLQDLINSVGGTTDDDELAFDDALDDEAFTTAIDNLHEAILFSDTLKALEQANPQLAGAIWGSVTEEHRNKLQQAYQYGVKYLQKKEEKRIQEEKDAKEKS